MSENQETLFWENASANAKRYHLRQLIKQTKNDVYRLRGILLDIEENDIDEGYVDPRYAQSDAALREAHVALRRALYHLEKTPVEQQFYPSSSVDSEEDGV